MASFNNAIDIVLDLEGGYQNHPEDWGNYNAYNAQGVFIPYAQRVGNTLRAGTNRGISAMLYSAILKREVAITEMQSISEALAKNIYKQVYWDKVSGDQINLQALANLIFDSKVNHGNAGIKIVQRVINTMGYSLEVDGIVGPQTLNAINTIAPISLHDKILDARIQLYHHLANTRPGNERFLQGWLNRLKKFPRMTSGGSSNGGNSTTSTASSNGAMFFVAALLVTTFFNDP